MTTFSNATEALKMLRTKKELVDIVLSDVHMPDMDGFKLLEAIGLDLNIPVISTSHFNYFCYCYTHTHTLSLSLSLSFSYKPCECGH